MLSKLAPITGQDFAFAHGRTGVLQQFLLTKSDVDRLLGAHDRKEAERILTELKLTSAIAQGLSRWEDILHAMEQWIRSEVEDMAPEHRRPAFSILWMEGDAPLIAYLLKKKAGLTSAISVQPESGLSAYDPEAVRLLFEEGNPGSLPDHLVAFAEKMRNTTVESPRMADASVTQYMADTQLKLARASGSKAITDFVRHRIDLTNIRTALRLLSSEEGDRTDELLSGGTIPVRKLKGSLSDLQLAIDLSPLAFTLTNDLVKPQTPTGLERALADVIAADIAEMWNATLSIEPLFAFAAMGMMHLRLIRVILIGKANGLSPQEIKKIIPPYLPASHYVL